MHDTTPGLSKPIGYLVALREHGRWTDTWDGTVHLTQSEAEASALEAAYPEDPSGCGRWEVVVCALVPVEAIRNPGYGDVRTDLKVNR